MWSCHNCLFRVYVSVKETLGMIHMACNDHDFGTVFQSFANQVLEKIIAYIILRQMRHHLRVAKGSIPLDNFLLISTHEVDRLDFDRPRDAGDRGQSLLDECCGSREPVQDKLESIRAIRGGCQANDVACRKERTDMNQALCSNVVHLIENDSAKA